MAAAARGHAPSSTRSRRAGRAPAPRAWRAPPLVEAAAATAGIEPDTLEAIVLLESAGRPDAAADPRSRARSGSRRSSPRPAATCWMTVDPAAARRIGRSLRRAARKGDDALIERLRARRRRVDERFDPPKALAATGALPADRRRGSAATLAVASYHMGIGNLQSALRDYGEDDISYARLYFDSTPLEHADAYRRLAALGDDSATYLWRVAAAREIMRLYRSDPAQLDRVSSCRREELRRGGPPSRSRDERFATPRDPRAAYDDGRIVPLRSVPPRARPADRPRHGRARIAGSAAAHDSRGLREPALALLAYLGTLIETISGQRH